MLHIQLDDATRTELQALRQTPLLPRSRDRLEMLFLSDAGWSPPRIAAHLGCDAQTVRTTLHGFQRRGRAALFPAPPGPPPDVVRRNTLLDKLRALLGQERTWTGAQLAEALRADGIPLGGRQVRRYLRLLKAGYRRTASTLEHKQNPAKVQHAKGVLGNLKKKHRRAS